MKRILIVFASVLTLLSCSQPVVLEETFDLPIDSLYIRCQNLKGLGQLHIGKTTSEQLRKDKGITLHEIFRKPSFANGYWGVSSILYDDLYKYLNENAKNIKQYHITDVVSKYKIGELEIDDVCLAFYNDTLVGIAFDCTNEMLNHYISKYGSGNGRKYNYTYRKGEYGSKNFTFEKKEIEERVWMNENLTMEYKYHWEQRTAPNEKEKLYHTKSCVISCNRRYNDYLKTIEEYKNRYNEEKRAKKKASLEGL